jgi:hypothetical protein
MSMFNDCMVDVPHALDFLRLRPTFGPLKPHLVFNCRTRPVFRRLPPDHPRSGSPVSGPCVVEARPSLDDTPPPARFICPGLRPRQSLAQTLYILCTPAFPPSFLRLSLSPFFRLSYRLPTAFLPPFYRLSTVFLPSSYRLSSAFQPL